MTHVTTPPSRVHRLGTTQQLMLRAIRWYQDQRTDALSPCRFFPSCSEYAVEAITEYGAWGGGLLTVRRLGRCRPFGPSGFDPVPERFVGDAGSDGDHDGCCAHSHGDAERQSTHV